MNSFGRNIPILAISQALMMSSMSLILSSAALVGYNIAQNPKLATLPIAVIFIAVMCTSIPAGIVMERIGRKKGFLCATFFGISGGLLACYAIMTSAFWLFVAAMFFIGMFNGFGNYYRFTAADVVSEQLKSKAISYVLAGGVLAALIGPNLAYYTRDLIPNAVFAASYGMLVLLYLLIFISLSFLKIPEQYPSDKQYSKNNRQARPLIEIIKQKKFIVAVLVGMFGYGVMSFIMTATPLAMQYYEHDFAVTSSTIQWHFLGMYIPAFFTGHLISRFGITRIMFIGAIISLFCIIVSLSGTSAFHFSLALVLLGFGWNFMFIGATTLLTETYFLSEKGKAQAFNDFIIFSTMTVASLSAGILQNLFGWNAVNYGAVPLLLVVVVSVLYLNYSKKTQVI